MHIVLFQLIASAELDTGNQWTPWKEDGDLVICSEIAPGVAVSEETAH